MRVLLADDHDMLRDMVADYLSPSGIEVVPAATLPEALRVASGQQQLDLVLLDIDMPGMNGLEGLEAMRRNRPDVPIAMLSGIADTDTVLDALRRGAAGFIPKTIGARSMLSAIQLIFGGERYVPSTLIAEVQARLSRAAEQTPSTRSEFSPDEVEILRLLKLGRSNKEIARTLGIEEYTVKYRLRSVFRKLGATNRTQAVTAALERDLP